MAVENAARLFQEADLVHWAEPNWRLTVGAYNIRTHDPRYEDGTLWYLHNEGGTGRTADADIDAPEGWAKRYNAPGVVIAVLDSGIRTTHEDLKDNLWFNTNEIPSNNIDDDGNGYIDDFVGWNLVPTPPSTLSTNIADDHGHGTKVASCFGAVANGLGPVGVAWDVKIMVVKVINNLGQLTALRMYDGVKYAVASGAHIINMSSGKSLGLPASDINSMNEAVQLAANAGIIFVGIAHNQTSDIDKDPQWPATFDHDNFISVTGSTATDSAIYNYGRVKVDLAAPSDNIYTATRTSDSSYASDSGTSLGAPITAGVAALLKAQYPRESYLQIINRVLSGVDKKTDFTTKCSTGGRLNLINSLSLATAAPPNDNFANRFVIAIPTGGATSITATGNNVEATKESGEPNHAGNTGGRSVWWEWTPGISATVSVKTKGSGINTSLAVYTGSSVGSLTAVGNNLITDGYGWATVTFTASSTATYMIAVDGYDAEEGTVRLTVETGTASYHVLKFDPSTLARTSTQFSFGLIGPASTAVEIFHSTDMVDWASLATVTLSGAGTYTYSDTSAGTSVPIRFYKAQNKTLSMNSANAVGFVDKTIPPGNSYICNPLSRSNNSLATLFSGWTSDRIYKYNPSTGVYDSTTYTGTSWTSGGGSWDLPPGFGFAYYNSSGGNRVVTFTGEVKQRSAISLPSVWALISSPLPVSRLLTSLAFPLESGDVVFRLNGGVQTSHAYWNGIWTPSQPRLAVGESVFIRRIANWRQNSSVFPPN
jgi:subtilisin family serine protease